MAVMINRTECRGGIFSIRLVQGMFWVLVLWGPPHLFTATASPSPQQQSCAAAVKDLANTGLAHLVQDRPYIGEFSIFYNPSFYRLAPPSILRHDRRRK